MQSVRGKTMFMFAVALLLLIVMIGGRALAGGAEQSGGGKQLSASEAALRYPYQQLTENEQKLYAALCEGIRAHEERIVLPDTYTKDVYERVYLMVAMQEPQFFYLDRYYELSDEMRTANILYAYTEEQADAMQKTLEAVADSVIAKLSPAQTDNQKLLMLHDALAQTCVYGKSTQSDNAYGALVEGTAMCEGYAEAYLYLARRAGMNAMCVPGTTGTDTKHMWNIAEIGGRYYNIDVTWDDDEHYQGKYVHSCFAVPDDRFADHVRDTAQFIPPACTGMTETYYMTRGLLLSDASQLPQSLQRWAGLTDVLEFYCTDRSLYDTVRSTVTSDPAVAEALRGIGVASRWHALMDEERQTIVILT